MLSRAPTITVTLFSIVRADRAELSSLSGNVPIVMMAGLGEMITAKRQSAWLLGKKKFEKNQVCEASGGFLTHQSDKVFFLGGGENLTHVCWACANC